MTQPNLSAKIGVTPLLGGPGASLKQPNLSATIGIKSLLGGAGAILEQTEKGQDWGKVIVGRCWRRFEATKLIRVKIVVGRCWCNFESEATKPVSRIGLKSSLGGGGICSDDTCQTGFG